LSFVSIIAGVYIRRSREVKNTPWAGLFPAGLFDIGTSKATRVNVPIVTRTRHAAIAQRGHSPLEDRTIKHGSMCCKFVQ
jgi:hypothetical protein